MKRKWNINKLKQETITEHSTTLPLLPPPPPPPSYKEAYSKQHRPKFLVHSFVTLTSENSIPDPLSGLPTCFMDCKTSRASVKQRKVASWGDLVPFVRPGRVSFAPQHRGSIAFYVTSAYIHFTIVTKQIARWIETVDVMTANRKKDSLVWFGL